MQREASIDELNSVISLITDLNEQLWAKTRSDQCSAEVKLLMTTVSRPFSALNRLGTFIKWPFVRTYSENESAQVDKLEDNAF